VFDPTIGRWQTKDPKSFAAGDTNLYRYVGNHPSYATDPSGLETKDGHTITRIGHHVVPASLWREFGFDPVATSVWDREDNRVGRQFAGVADESHTYFAHGSSGYNGHVRVELSNELAKYMKKNKITDGKLTVEQQRVFAEYFANHIKYNTSNEFIKGFNKSIDKGGRSGLYDWYEKTGKNLDEPIELSALTIVKGVAKSSLLKSAGKAIVKKGAKYALAPLFATWAYNEARANGASPEDAAGLAAYEVWAPPGMSKSDLDAMEKRYRDTVENAAKLGRGIGNPEDFEGTILGPGFVRGRQTREYWYRELGIDNCDLNIYGDLRGK
jgi:hypothetical protein